MSDKEQATMKSPILTLALAGTLVLSALPAQAGHHHAGDALAAGLIGLGIGLAVTAPRTYYYDAPPVYYAPREVVIEREYVPPRRIYYDRPYRRHHRHHRHYYYDD
jgi:hypothetical protein